MHVKVNWRWAVAVWWVAIFLPVVTSLPSQGAAPPVVQSQASREPSNSPQPPTGAAGDAPKPPLARARPIIAASTSGSTQASGVGLPVPRHLRGADLTFNETGHHKTFMFAKSNTFIQLDGEEIVHFQLRLCREISFAFRTRLPHGLLVYHSVKGRPASMDPYALYVIVEKGQLKILHVFGKQSTSLVVGEALSDDRWHRVEVRIDVHQRQLTALVDGKERVSPIAGLQVGNNYGVEEQLSSVVLIGGLSPEEKLHGVKYIIESFVGCITNMTLKTGKDASHLRPIVPLVATKHENVVEGCINQCKTRENLCFIGSKCINHYNSLTCDCFGTNYEGEQCDIYTATILTLRGSSYVSYRVYDWKDRVHTSQNRISMYFKTLYDDSVLFYASGEPGQHYIAVSLKNSTIHVRMRFGEKIANMTIGTYTSGNHWHNLTIAHYCNIIRIHFNDETKEVEFDGENTYLYIDPEIYFGGGPELDKKEGLVSTNNFVGSLKYVFFNDVSILYELKKGNPKVHYIGVLSPEFYETDVEVIPLTFPFHSSHIWWTLKQSHNLSLYFDFKGSRNTAVLASSEVITEGSKKKGYWEVRQQNDEIHFELVPDNSTNESSTMTVKFDGKPGWHAIDLKYLNGEVTLTVDYRYKETKTFTDKFTLSDILWLAIGAGSRNIGLIGCMRDIKINGEALDPRAIVHSLHAIKEVSLDNCQLVDPCKRPNTCEHGGKCSIQDDQVVCNCNGTDYIGKNCHFSIYRKTCEELALLGYTKPDTYLIDIDGNGPFPPAHVKCEFQSLEDSTKTIVEHNLPSQMDVRKSNMEDFSLKIEYREFTAEMLQELISHSLHCSQYIKYECSNAPLELHSATWFISSYKNDIVDYIGNVKRGACPCAVNRTCVNPSHSCNCDIIDSKWNNDEGYYTTPQSIGITEMVFLQRKELGVDSKARITLGPVECVEANTQKYVVTFTSSQSYIEVPGWRKGDISFSFRTTGEKAILLYQPPIRERHPSFMVALTNDFQLTFNFTLNTGHSRELEIKSQRRLNGGEWQKIWIDYNEHHVRFMINTDYQMVDLRPEEEFGPFEGSMFIGGATEDLLKESSVQQGLIGCFRGLVVNGEILDIYSYMSVHLSEIIKDCKPSCDPNPCVNRAKCKELWSTFQCICENPWAHEGQYCERNINTNGITFLTEDSYLKKNDLFNGGENVTAKLANLLSENILINLRTYDQNALILYANDHLNNFVHLDIKNGRYINFLYNYGNTIIKITVDYPDLSSGKSVQVAVLRRENETILNINDKNTSVNSGKLLLTEYSNKPWNNSEIEVLGPHRPPAAPTAYFQFILGGFAPDSLLMYSREPALLGYVGCLRGLKIGNETVDLPAQNTDESFGIRNNCQMVCDKEPCKNQGICIEDFNKGESTCQCERTSYHGEFCTEEKGAEFGGESVIQRKFILDGSIDEIKVQLAFSSSDNSDKRPLLLLLQTENRRNYYLLIGLANSEEMVFQEDRDGSTYGATVKYRNFLNGARHSVYYHRVNDTAVLLVDRELETLSPLRVMSLPEMPEKEVGVNEVHLGGQNTTDPRFAAYRSFTGCLSNAVIEVNKKPLKPIEEYFKFIETGGDEVNGMNAVGIRIAKCAIFGEMHKPRPGPSMNISIGRNKEWIRDQPARIPYKSLYSDSSTEEANSSTIIFLVMACVFVFIVMCALCEVYRTHRKHKKRLEREAEAAILWPKTQPPSILTPSIKLQGFKPNTLQDKSKSQYNGTDTKSILKNDYKQVPTSPPVEDQTKPPVEKKLSNGKTQEQELEWEPLPENTELILDKSLEDLQNAKDEEENDIPKKAVYNHKNHTLPYSIDELGSIEFTTTPYA